MKQKTTRKMLWERAHAQNIALYPLLGIVLYSEIMPILSHFFFLAVFMACGSSWARDGTHAMAVIPAAAVTTLMLNPLHHKGTPILFNFILHFQIFFSFTNAKG